MAQKVTAMDVRMAAAMAGGVGNVARFCRDQQISRQTFYKWRRRFAASGIDGLQELSRRPGRRPGQTPPEVEDLVVRWRKQLTDTGADNGPDSIRYRLIREPVPSGARVPSRATIWRILVRRGMVVPQPQKRPHSALRRFSYARPNECWQSDWTAWRLSDGTPVALAGSLDDHSRYLTGLRAAAGDATTALVWQVMTAGITECGIPARSLTDNGRVYTGKRYGHEATFEANLRHLGVHQMCSTPHHPQTCGKIERFWQTLKKWLAAQPAADTVEELNAQLDRFRRYYNHDRPHRALHGRTPAEAFTATVKARPADRPLPTPVFCDQAPVHPNGNVSAGPYLVNVGRRWAGHTVHVIRDGDHITIFSGTKLVRTITADPTRRYQPAPHTGMATAKPNRMSNHECQR
jgi:transposase InsO family protein